MKFTSLVAASLVVTSALAGTPVEDFWNRVRGFRDGTVVPVSPKNQGGVRYEINTLQSSQPLQFTLFIQGLTSMQKDQQTRLGSFYALSGIHGRPFSPWNNEPTCGANCVSNSGYCVHNGLMFATWHRPYLSLFEQWIWRYAYSWLLSQRLTGAELARWQSALEKLRLPYWDWTRNAGALPRATTDANLNIQLPNNRRANIVNPLNNYNFHWPTVNGRQRVDDLGPIGQQYPRGSIRSPNGGRQDNNRSNNVMRGQWGNLSRGVYEMLMNPRYKTYGAMVRQLENLHNIVHGAVGNGGHMTYIDVAAFDPIFWLHHCMIDRLFDIWQAINPTVRFTERVRFRGNFEISSRDLDAADTYLKPFRGTRRCPSENLGQCFVNSNDAWSTMSYGYFYHDTRNRNPGTVQAWVNGAISRTGKKLKKRALAAGAAPPSANSTDVKVLNDYTWRGTVNIDPKACGTTCYVHLFAGQPSSNPADWLTQKELIGSTVVLGMAPKQELLHNSTEYLFGNGSHLDQGSHMDGMKMAKLVEGTVEFNGFLDEYEGTPSNCPKVIQPWLTKNLQIRVQKANGEEIPLSRIPSLKVGIKSQPYGAPSAPEEAPTYGSEKLYRDITKNIIGGLGRCDTLGKGLPF